MVAGHRRASELLSPMAASAEACFLLGPCASRRGSARLRPPRRQASFSALTGTCPGGMSLNGLLEQELGRGGSDQPRARPSFAPFYLSNQRSRSALRSLLRWMTVLLLPSEGERGVIIHRPMILFRSHVERDGGREPRRAVPLFPSGMEILPRRMGSSFEKGNSDFLRKSPSTSVSRCNCSFDEESQETIGSDCHRSPGPSAA